MRIEKCHFCSSPCYPGHGSTFVRNDAKMFRFCRSKCQKNFKIKKNPRKTKWTKAFRRILGKELNVDSCLEFERKTLNPIKYNRDLFEKAVDAIQTVEKIKKPREILFQRDRIGQAKEMELEGFKKNIEKNISFIKDKTEEKYLKEKEKILE